MDFNTDQSGRHLVRLSNLIDAPDYVKEASVILEDVEKLPNAAFGLPHKREFPIDTPGHVWLSYGYCKSAGIQDKLLLEKLGNAAEHYDIKKDLDAIDQAFSALTKQASHSHDYAVTVDFGTPDPASPNPGVRRGGVQGFYPIDTAYQVETSSIKLANDRSKIPLELFAEGCRKIVKAAAEKGVPHNLLPRNIVAYGVDRFPHEGSVRQAAELLKQATGDDIYLQIAEAAIENPEKLPGHAFAELWHNADLQNNVKAAGQRVDPFLLFNSGPTVEEMERQVESWVAIADAPVPVTKVASVREADVRKWFGKEVADKIVTLVKQAAKSTGSELTAAFSDLDASVQRSFVRHLIST